MMFWQIGLGYLLLGKRLAPIQVSFPTQSNPLKEASQIIIITSCMLQCVAMQQKFSVPADSLEAAPCGDASHQGPKPPFLLLLPLASPCHLMI